MGLRPFVVYPPSCRGGGFHTLCPFRHTSIRYLLFLIRVEAVKLAQAGIGDFLVDTRVRRLKWKRDDNKEVYRVNTVTLLDFN